MTLDHCEDLQLNCSYRVRADSIMLLNAMREVVAEDDFEERVRLSNLFCLLTLLMLMLCSVLRSTPPANVLMPLSPSIGLGS